MIFPEYSEKSGEFDKNRETGDCMNFRETPGKIGRVGMSEFDITRNERLCLPFMDIAHV
jgi:hypothetical protein